jgi:Ca2+-binding EF-hand superfamily protein
MGASLGKGANRMAIAAMANVVQFDKEELQAMQKKFKEIAQRQGNPSVINREEFQEGLHIVGIQESDKEILDRLFTMLDKTGDDMINFKEFLVGIAPMINGDAVDKIGFAFECYDVDATKQVKAEEMKFILTSMNNTCSYFGDATLTKEELARLVEDIYRDADVSQSGTIAYAEYITALAQHPILVQFLANEK